MTVHLCTTREKLDEIERLIDEERRLTGRRNEILRAVAADLRARLESAPSVTLLEIERRLVAVARAEHSMGVRPTGTMVGLAQEVAARWPVVKVALERFGAEVEENAA